MSYIIDTHADTLSLLNKNNFLCGSSTMNLSLPRLIRGNVGLQCLAVCVHPNKDRGCFENGIRLVNEFEHLYKSIDLLMPIKCFDDIQNVINTNKIGIMLTLEGADMLDSDIDKIDLLYDKGVRIFAFTWNNSNFLSGGIGENKDGLTDKGILMLKKCEDKGVLIDVSHISEKGFWDIAENSIKPFIASHSNAKKICNNKRNLSDEQLKAIKNCGGSVGINFYPPFLNELGFANIDDIIGHIEYIAGLIGIEYISIGSDFDGVDNDLPYGMEHPGKLQTIPNRLARMNYTQQEIDCICHDNMLRVFSKVLK